MRNEPYFWEEGGGWGEEECVEKGWEISTTTLRRLQTMDAPFPVLPPPLAFLPLPSPPTSLVAMLRTCLSLSLSGLSFLLLFTAVGLLAKPAAVCVAVTGATVAGSSPLSGVLCSTTGATTVAGRMLAVAAFSAAMAIRANLGLLTVTEGLRSPLEFLAPLATGGTVSDRVARFTGVAALAALVTVVPGTGATSVALSLFLAGIFAAGFLVREGARERRVRVAEEARLWSDDAIRARELAAHAGLASGSLMTAENELANENTSLDYGLLTKGVVFILAFYGVLATTSVPAFARFFFVPSLAAEPIARFPTAFTALIRIFGATCLLAAGHLSEVDSLTFGRRQAHVLREVSLAWLVLHAADLLLLHGPHATLQLSWNVIFVTWWSFVATSAHGYLRATQKAG